MPDVHNTHIKYVRAWKNGFCVKRYNTILCIESTEKPAHQNETTTTATTKKRRRRWREKYGNIGTGFGAKQLHAILICLSLFLHDITVNNSTFWFYHVSPQLLMRVISTKKIKLRNLCELANESSAVPLPSLCSYLLRRIATKLWFQYEYFHFGLVCVSACKIVNTFIFHLLPVPFCAVTR